MLFEDESMIRDYQVIMKTWFPVGKQRIIPTYGKHEGNLTKKSGSNLLLSDIYTIIQVTKFLYSIKFLYYTSIVLYNTYFYNGKQRKLPYELNKDDIYHSFYFISKNKLAYYKNL